MCWFFSKKKESQPQSTVAVNHTSVNEVKETPKFERFILTIEAASSHVIADPSAQDIQNAVRAICASEEHFLVLEAKQAINGITFMQATGFERSDNTIYMEVQCKEASASGVVARNYGKMVGVSTLVKTLTDYMSGITPTGMRDWDFSGEF